MATELSMRPQSDGSIGDLARSTLTAFCLVGLIVGWAWWMAAASLNLDFAVEASQARALIPPTLMSAVSGACLLRVGLPLPWRNGLFLVGMGCVFLLSYLWLGSTASLPYLSLVVIVAGMLVGSGASLAAALALTLALLLFGRVDPRSRPIAEFVPALGLLWAAALASWLSSRNLYTALRWALHSQQRANSLLAELRERQGELNRTLAALTEASRRLERTNQELALARQRAGEARALKEHFAANVSHELRTPLNLIVGFSEIMYLEPDSYDGARWTPELQSDVGELYRASRHLQSLVNDILDLARIDAARLPMYRELANLREIVAEALDTISPLLRQKGLALRRQWAEELPPVFVDRTRIRQVLLNLLNNAVRFTDAGSVTVGTAQADDAVVVSVRDTGVGIAPDKLPSIFEEFQQVDDGLRRRGGAGLGLALSRQFVELHGGRMWAESQVGVGSTFSFSLPLPGAVRQTSPLLRVPERKMAEPADTPLVVVDADPSVATMLSRYLGDRPLLAAKDDAEAERLIESQHPGAVIVNQPPDLPADAWIGGLGEASRRYNVPVFRCSIPSPSWLKQSTDLDDCLSKPVSRETLGATVGRYCGAPSTVLVIDDDPGFASLMVRVLGMISHVARVVVAYSGAEGLRLAHEARPRLVLLDLLLPDMHGLTVLQALRGDPVLSGVRVVAVTATTYAEEALLLRGGHFTLSQSEGISTGTLAELLNAACQIVRPDYVIRDG